MIYTVRFSADFAKQMKKHDRDQAKLIVAWIDNHLVNQDPRSNGKPLTANYKGSSRYRVGDYHILAEIIDDVLILYLLMVTHQSQATR